MLDIMPRVSDKLSPLVRHSTTFLLKHDSFDTESSHDATPSLLDIIRNARFLESCIADYLPEADLYRLFMALPCFARRNLQAHFPPMRTKSLEVSTLPSRPVLKRRSTVTMLASASSFRRRSRQTTGSSIPSDVAPLAVSSFWRNRFATLYAKNWNLNLCESSSRNATEMLTSLDQQATQDARVKSRHSRHLAHEKHRIVDVLSDPEFWRNVCLTAGTRTCPLCGTKCPPKPKIEREFPISAATDREDDVVVRCSVESCGATLSRHPEEYMKAAAAVAKCALIPLLPLLPECLQPLNSLEQLYSSSVHGSSLRTLLNNVGDIYPVIITVTQQLPATAPGAPRTTSEPFGIVVFHPLNRFRRQTSGSPKHGSNKAVKADRRAPFARRWSRRASAVSESPAVMLFTSIPDTASKQNASHWWQRAARMVSRRSQQQIDGTQPFEREGATTVDQLRNLQSHKEATVWEPSALVRSELSNPSQWLFIHEPTGIWTGQALEDYNNCALSLASDLSSGTSWMSSNFVNKRSLSATQSFAVQSVVAWATRDSIERSQAGGSDYECIRQHNLEAQKNVDRAILLPVISHTQTR